MDFVPLQVEGVQLAIRPEEVSRSHCLDKPGQVTNQPAREQ